MTHFISDYYGGSVKCALYDLIRPLDRQFQRNTGLVKKLGVGAFCPTERSVLFFSRLFSIHNALRYLLTPDSGRASARSQQCLIVLSAPRAVLFLVFYFWHSHACTKSRKRSSFVRPPYCACVVYACIVPGARVGPIVAFSYIIRAKHSAGELDGRGAIFKRQSPSKGSFSPLCAQGRESAYI